MTEYPQPPGYLRSRNPLAWLRIFGPGAIIASLTIGTGELIFSSRGGAIFGYPVLSIFLVISVLKWALVLATARHVVLSGAHPFERWAELPGPRGWLPVTVLLPGLVCIPIWVGFHALTNGTLIQDLLPVDKHGGGAVVLAIILVLVLRGGYNALERVQLTVVTAMLVCVAISAVLMNPPWLEVLKGFFVPEAFEYPGWVRESYPKLAERSVWVETSTYVAVIGGASYDYLAYVSFLRDKSWGLAGRKVPASTAELEIIAADPHHPVRKWLRAPLVDCTLSFTAVVAFSAVFVVSGAMVLGAAETIPDADNLLGLQAEFVTRLHEWLYPLYIVGAFLTLLGTFYGTVEVAPAILRELVRALSPSTAARHARRIRAAAVYLCAFGGYLVLDWNALMTVVLPDAPTLIELVTPAAIFTGVFSCSFVCLLSPFVDRRFLPRALRMHPLLAVLNVVAGLAFLGVGLRSYWDYGSRFTAPESPAGGWIAMVLSLGILPLGFLVTWVASLVVRRRGTT